MSDFQPCYYLFARVGSLRPQEVKTKLPEM